MTDGELEQKLHKLAKADIISYGRNSFYFRGLGDKIFEIVFRRMYENDMCAHKQHSVIKCCVELLGNCL
jgi:hypothetical protein